MSGLKLNPVPLPKTLPEPQRPPGCLLASMLIHAMGGHTSKPDPPPATPTTTQGRRLFNSGSEAGEPSVVLDVAEEEEEEGPLGVLPNWGPYSVVFSASDVEGSFWGSPVFSDWQNVWFPPQHITTTTDATPLKTSNKVGGNACLWPRASMMTTANQSIWHL